MIFCSKILQKKMVSFLRIFVFFLLRRAFCYEEYFECFNDYESEINCKLFLNKPTKCSEYKLNVSHSVIDEVNMYTCSFENGFNTLSECECKSSVDGFVTTENFSATLLKGQMPISTKLFTTEDFIKPKTPDVSVTKTESGNFKVTWNDRYKNREHLRHFLDNLRVDLNYGIKGKRNSMVHLLQNSVKSFEIVGKNLQPNVKYILTARMSSDYNNNKIFSDRSKEIEFTTSASLENLLQTLIPAVCVSLIVIISIIFICVLRIKKTWWDKISKPKLDFSFVGSKHEYVQPSPNKISSHISFETKPKFEEKELFAHLSIDTSHGDSSHIGSVVYGETGPSLAIEDHVSRNRAKQIRDSGNCSGSFIISNRSYSETSSVHSSCFIDVSSVQSDMGVPHFSSKSDLNSHATVNLPYEYQDLALLNAKNKADVEDKRVTEKLFISPIYPSAAFSNCVSEFDDGYQDIQSLTRNSEKVRVFRVCV